MNKIKDMNLKNMEISKNTLITEDILQAIFESFEDMQEIQSLKREFDNLEEGGEEYQEYAESILEDVINILNGIAPLNYYFGAHFGDGSSFGFWRIEDGELFQNIREEAEEEKFPVYCMVNIILDIIEKINQDINSKLLNNISYYQSDIILDFLFDSEYSDEEKYCFMDEAIKFIERRI